MKRIWKKLFAFVCAFTLVAAPVTYNTVNADAPSGLNSNGVQIGKVSIGNNSTTSSNNASVGTDYTLTIPATLNVANAGWNATDGITAKVKDGDTFDTSKKLTVTAVSTNSWALKSGENSIGYNLATKSGTYSSSAEPVSWEFSADDLNAAGAAPKGMGIIVDDYSSKPAGNYSDTVTFTAKVETANPYAAKNIGDVITFGSYSWYIIDKSDDGVKLLMESPLHDNRKYNDSDTNVTWETCTLREYLNGDFYNSFSADDKAKIVLTHNSNPDNPDFSTSGGNDTDDYIYLLSIAEANALDENIRKCDSLWVLRSPAYGSNRAACVFDDGDVNTLGGVFVYEEVGVRPVLNLKF